MTVLTETIHTGEWLISEANAFQSRDQVTVTVSGATKWLSGTLLTDVDTGAATFAMDAGSTGNPTSSAITVGAAAKPGGYRIIFTAATLFEVEDPDGVLVDNGTLGTAFSAGGLGFTLTAGGTAAVSGSTATITVAAGTGKFVKYTADRAAGPAKAILYNELDPVAGDIKATVINRDAEVFGTRLTGLDAAATADLRALGIKVR